MSAPNWTTLDAVRQEALAAGFTEFFNGSWRPLVGARGNGYANWTGTYFDPEAQRYGGTARDGSRWSWPVRRAQNDHDSAA
jgi:hypothetical protein